MHQSKLLRILSTFAPKDWRDFASFKKGHDLGKKETDQLYAYLQKYKNNLASGKLEIAAVHGLLYPGITRKSFQNIMSKLTAVVEEYLRWEWLVTNEQEFDLSLLHAYNSRGLYHLFDLKADNMKTTIGQNRNIDIWKKYTSLRLNHEHFFSDNPIKNKQGVRMLRRVSKDLLGFSNDSALFYQSVMAYYGRIANVNFEDDIQDLKALNLDRANDPNSHILKHLYLLNQSKVPQSFDILFAEVVQNQITLSPTLHSAVVLSLLHYAQREFETGSSNTADAILSLYSFGIESGALLVNQKITATRFVNIVNTACACGSTDWAIEFIHTYEHLLDDSGREETVRISRAQIQFYLGAYDEVLRLLSDISFSLFTNTVRARWLMLGSYFMEFKEDLIFLDAMVKNYSSFFYNNRKKLSVANFRGSLNLAHLLRLHHNQASVMELINEINSAEDLVFRTWLTTLVKK